MSFALVQSTSNHLRQFIANASLNILLSLFVTIQLSRSSKLIECVMPDDVAKVILNIICEIPRCSVGLP